MSDHTRSLGDYDKVPQESTHPASFSSAVQDEPKRSWKALFLMAAGLLCGAVLAVGHHLLYRYLDGKPVNDISLPQSWAFRMGNLLAFLVKLSLATTVSVAFVQRQWLMLRRQPFTVKDVDTLTNILASILRLFDSFLWLKYPLLTGTAIICWLLPLLPIIVPGTLTVISTDYPIEDTFEVPLLNSYNDLEWTNATMVGGVPTILTGTSLLSQIVFAAATEGRILSIPADFLNETYHSKFNGPAVKCTTDTNQSFLAKIQTPTTASDPSPTSNVYLSWVGGDDTYAMSDPTASVVPQTLDMDSADVSRLYIIPHFGTDTTSTLVATECRFYNATYSVDITFNNGEQEVDIQNVTYLDPLCYSTWYAEVVQHDNDQVWPNVANLTLQTAARRAYLGLVQKFGSLFVGRETLVFDAHFQGYQSTFTSKDLLPINFTASISEVERKVEELFQNITISLLSRTEFWANSTEPCGDESSLSPYTSRVPSIAEACAAVSQESDADITFTPWVLEYNYAPFALFLAYGLALLLTFGCFAIGSHAFLINHGSYSNSFSTFIRVATSSELQHHVAENDSGMDPRPERLASAMVDINPSGHSTSFDSHFATKRT